MVSLTYTIALIYLSHFTSQLHWIDIETEWESERRTDLLLSLVPSSVVCCVVTYGGPFVTDCVMLVVVVVVGMSASSFIQYTGQ